MNALLRKRLKGIAMVIVGGSLWGISGTVAQVLFQRYGFQAGGLVTIRLLCAGILLLFWAGMKKQGIWAVWKDPRTGLKILIFGLIGMLGVQYSYYASIQSGNAATATLLQYLGPVFITVYMALKIRQLSGKNDIVALVLAMLGTFLLVTNGSLKGLTVPLPAVLWGLVSALTAAFYTVYPGRLISRFGSVVIVGWGMLVGGIGMGLVNLNAPGRIKADMMTPHVLALVGFVVIFGTLLSFYLYLDSLRYLSPDEVGILGSAEPLSAAVMSVFCFHHIPGAFELAGGLCIISTVAILSRKKEEKVVPMDQKTVV
ncbi:DMT family transporter [Thermoactinomyces sp. CICC 10523]|uniref:EamA family transporter n=1 Tax=Thermoactinomyces sp. CICC 10523 TaxID=2767428 RepID=UPI00351CAABE